MSTTRHVHSPSRPGRAGGIGRGATRSARIGPWTWSDPVVRAWVMLGLLPVFALLALGAAQGVYALLGYRVGTDDAPGWVDRVTGLAGFVTFLAPCLLVVRYGNRARAGRDPRGWAPLVLGGLVAVWWLATGAFALALSF
jgi:hypothetical protein